jgi:hypothetical protein
MAGGSFQMGSEIFVNSKQSLTFVYLKTEVLEHSVLLLQLFVLICENILFVVL